MVLAGSGLFNDFVDPQDLDPHLLCRRDCTSHLQNNIIRDIQEVKSFELSHIFLNLLENEFLDRGPMGCNPFKDISLCSENANIKGLLLVRNLRDIFEKGMVSTIKGGTSRRLGPFGHESIVVPGPILKRRAHYSNFCFFTMYSWLLGLLRRLLG